MPDIMMCTAENCPKSSTCYRHADSGTQPCEWRQTYWLRDDSSPIGDACDHYWQANAYVKAAHDGSF